MDEMDARVRFEVYKNYLRGLSCLLDLKYPTYADLLGSCGKNAAHRGVVAIPKVGQLLHNSWNTEFLLKLPLAFGLNFLKFSNHWSPVQAYYSVYLALRALIVAKGSNASGDHRTTLNTVCSYIGTEHLFPYPWDTILDSHGYATVQADASRSNTILFSNVDGHVNDGVYLHGILTTFLKTTRERILEERCDEWRRSHPVNGRPRKRLLPGMREKLESSQRGTSIFDCLYRLRIRSNYKDADIFLLGSTEDAARQYFDAICRIIDGTLFVIERSIRYSIGNNDYDSILDEYEKSSKLDLGSSTLCNPRVRVGHM